MTEPQSTATKTDNLILFQSRLPDIDSGSGWTVVRGFSLSEFILAMLDNFGELLETLLVGAFKEEGRGAQRHMILDMHQDGIRSPALERRQGSTYVENPDVDVVGMYCIRENPECVTLIQSLDTGVIDEVVLRSGEALLFDNRRVNHGRVGPVGARVLFRMWMSRA